MGWNFYFSLTHSLQIWLKMFSTTFMLPSSCCGMLPWGPIKPKHSKANICESRVYEWMFWCKNLASLLRDFDDSVKKDFRLTSLISTKLFHKSEHFFCYWLKFDWKKFWNASRQQVWTTLSILVIESLNNLSYSRVDKGRIVQIVNSLPNFAQMSPTISRFDLEGVPKISRP